VDVLNYGFSFFIEAFNEHQFIANGKVKDMALAFWKASKTDAREFNKWLKRK